MFTIVYAYICTVFTPITLLKPNTNIIQMWGKSALNSITIIDWIGKLLPEIYKLH